MQLTSCICSFWREKNIECFEFISLFFSYFSNWFLCMENLLFHELVPDLGTNYVESQGHGLTVKNMK